MTEKDRSRADTKTPARALRRLDETFEEYRFQAQAEPRAYLGVSLMSLGGVALGAASYATWLREASAQPIDYAPYLFLIGSLMVLGYILFGQAATSIVTVSNFGVAVSTTERGAPTPWYDIDKMTLDDRVLRIESKRGSVSIVTAQQPAAVRHLVEQGRLRIAKRLDVADEDVEALARSSATAGVTVTVAEAPQVTAMKCRASARPLSVEKDVRMCSRCGAMYHRAGVPKRCKDCGKKFRSR
jgi:hypothetical protein